MLFYDLLLDVLGICRCGYAIPYHSRQKGRKIREPFHGQNRCKRPSAVIMVYVKVVRHTSAVAPGKHFFTFFHRAVVHSFFPYRILWILWILGYIVLNIHNIHKTLLLRKLWIDSIIGIIIHNFLDVKSIRMFTAFTNFNPGFQHDISCLHFGNNFIKNTFRLPPIENGITILH